MHHHTAHACQNAITAVRLERVVIEERAIQQRSLQAQARDSSQVETSAGEIVSQANHQALSLLGGDVQQVRDGFFARFRDVFGVVFFENQEIDQQKEQPKDAQGKGKLVIEIQGGEHGFALDPSLKTGCL